MNILAAACIKPAPLDSMDRGHQQRSGPLFRGMEAEPHQRGIRGTGGIVDSRWAVKEGKDGGQGRIESLLDRTSRRTVRSRPACGT